MDYFKDLNSIAEFINDSRRIVITSHIKIDGDGLGSELSLKRALVSLGKEVKVINDCKVPSNLSFLLNNDNEVEIFDEEKSSEFILNCDLIIVLDVALLYRLGKIEPLFKNSRAKKVCIDHHLEGEEAFEIKVAKVDASSTGEIVYDLLKIMNFDFDKDTATPLYASIIIDSGNLSYERCVKETYIIVSRLVEKGVDPYQIHINLHWCKTLNQLKLEEKVISNLKIAGEITYSYITSEDSLKLGLDPLEFPDIVHIPLSLKCSEIALLFVENGGKEIKVSARSKGKVKICKLAKEFGGGGHSLAAGFVVEGDLEKAIEVVLKRAKQFLEEEAR
jgi:phosphoesterase RecJ-like protein